ncbi:MAG: hydroxymethylglutaryl-CoA lyase [Phycisphaerales bacterium]|nr:hydroxymethylglutaryl-CoA lyase [Phycisphaerales bacterium]
MTKHVRICDVAPRDGLQNEPGVISAADKVRLIDMLLACNLAEIEATSFVSPAWVPQLGDAAEVLAGVRRLLAARPSSPLISALVPNEKGFERALEVHQGGLPLKIALFTAASESFNRKNINATIAESIERFRPIVPRAIEAGMPIRVYVSCAVACPFEGAIAPLQVRKVVDDVLAIFPQAARGKVDIDLGDTIGVAHPADIAALLAAFSAEEIKQLTIHLHDTYGRAADCVRAALHAGVRSFDGSAGGLGGCPYATSAVGKRAPGNIATELLVETIEREGFATGVDRERLAETETIAVQLRNRRPSPDLPSADQPLPASGAKEQDPVRIVRHTAGSPGVAASFGEVVLDRPEKRNALTPAMLDAIITAIDELAHDDSVHAIVLRGEGKSFCAGFDLDVCHSDPEALPALLKGLSAAVRAMRAAPKAVVVGVQGAAVAGGCALLGGADFVVADEVAKFGYPVTLLGISPAVSAPTLRAMTAGGPARTRLLEPKLIDAAEARQIGLVHQVVQLPEDVTPRAQLRAQEFAAKPPQAFATTKAWLNEIAADDVDAWMERALEVSLGLVGGEEQVAMERRKDAEMNRRSGK